MKMIQDDPVPIQKLRSVSTNLKNLLSWLLEKDPVSWITYEELI
jgi:hypothetical protein